MQAQYKNQAPATIEGLIRKVFDGADVYSFEHIYEDSPSVDAAAYGILDKDLDNGLKAHVEFDSGLYYSDGIHELTGQFTVAIEGPGPFEYVEYAWFVSTKPGDPEMADLMRLFPEAENCLKIVAAQAFAAILEDKGSYSIRTIEHAKLMLQALDPDGTLDY